MNANATFLRLSESLSISQYRLEYCWKISVGFLRPLEAAAFDVQFLLFRHGSLFSKSKNFCMLKWEEKCWLAWVQLYYSLKSCPICTFTQEPDFAECEREKSFSTISTSSTMQSGVFSPKFFRHEIVFTRINNKGPRREPCGIPESGLCNNRAYYWFLRILTEKIFCLG